MPYFEAKNEGGIFQIEEGSVTLGLVQVTTPTFGAGSNFRTATVTYSGNANSHPVVVLHNPQNTGAVMGLLNTTVSGSTWTFTVVIAADLSSGFSNLTSIRVLIFDRPAVQTTGTGVEFYDATGKILWSSNKKALKIIGSMSTSYPTGTYGTLVGGAIFGTDVEYEQLTTGDWQTTVIKELDGYYNTSTGGNLETARYSVDVTTGGNGGSNSGTTLGVDQPGFIVDIAGYI